MTQFTRRHILGCTVGAATVLAGCSESESSSGFTQTSVEGEELVVEFEESLEAETIAVVDPAGESFAESEVSAGVSRVTFEISIPYAPGEYRIVATDGEETVAETTQAIRPELEIVDVGVGANRMDEMPESLGHARRAEGILTVENVGSGPEKISQLQFKGDLPNPRELHKERIGIYDPELKGEAREPIEISTGTSNTLYTSTLPFTFEGNGIDCASEKQSGRITVEFRGVIGGAYTAEYHVEYSASEAYNGCDILIEEPN